MFPRYWFLWAKTRIILEMFPILMVAMGQNIDYLDNGFHSNGCYTIASSFTKHCYDVAKQPDGGCHEVMGVINLAN